MFLQVSATDPDCGVNAMVNYTLGDGFRQFHEFEIRPVSGDICISGQLDHESRSVYEFPVVATDTGEILDYRINVRNGYGWCWFENSAMVMRGSNTKGERIFS